MKLHIIKSPVGILVYNEEGKIVDFELFPPKPEKIAEKISSESEEEKRVRKRISEKYECEIETGPPPGKLEKTYRDISLEKNWTASDAELNRIITEAVILLTKIKLKMEKRDKILMQAVTTLEEIEKAANLFSEKLREWYGLYFPELARNVKSNERLARLVFELGRKELMEKEFKKMAEKSVGMEFSEEDMEAIKSLSKTILEIYKTRKEIADYIERAAKETIPNMSAVAGEILACKLIALAGGLEKISRMPSSTIQLLGSEKALFRHLRGGGKAPKYGVLFTHPYVQTAPKNLRGKVARHIAAKISIASKIDYFSKDNRGEELKKELEKEIKSITGK